MKCRICLNDIKEISREEGNSAGRCSKCGQIYISADENKTGIRENPWGGSGLFDKFRIALTWLRMKKLNIEYGTSVLEIGYGRGVLLEKFYKSGCSISGVEAGLITETENEFLKKNAELFEGDIEIIELPEKKYDLIYGIHLIEHIEDSEAFFDKCKKSLKKNGTVYFITPNGNSLGTKIFGYSWWNYEDPTHRQFFNPISARIALMNAGFKEIKIKIPVTDSLMVEVNSLLRLLGQKSGKAGVMDSFVSKALGIALIPVSLLLRLLVPPLSPSIEIRAVKS